MALVKITKLIPTNVCCSNFKFTTKLDVHWYKMLFVEYVRYIWSNLAAPMISGTQIYRVPIVPDINPGIASEADKRFAQKQRATFRRLFMDIEREQVKENARRLEHRRHIKL